MDVHTTWRNYRNWLADHFPKAVKRLQPGASEIEMDRLKTHVGLPLPASLIALYGMNNGESQGKPGLFWGIKFLRISEVIEEIETRKRKGIESGAGSTNELRFSYLSSQPEGAIKHLAHHSFHIPLARNAKGNFIGIDLDPGPKGNPGQIIAFGPGLDDRFVVADSLEAFLDFMEKQRLTGVLDKSIIEDELDEFKFGLSRTAGLIEDLRRLLPGKEVLG